MAKISVIMGVYNSKKIELLSKSIESILNQTYNDFEFIICDDCSSDKKTLETLENFAKKDNRIKLLHNEKNLGLAATLNYCLELSTGEYIARQDDDDISHLDRFQKQIDFLDNNPSIALVGCNLNLFDDNNIWGQRKHKEYPTKKDFLYGSQFPHPATIIRSIVINEIGKYTVSKITRRTEDYDLYMRLYYFGYCGVNIQENLYDYYENDLNYKQQKFKYRIDEFKLKIYWFKKLKLFPRGYIYCIKPIVSGMIPIRIKKILKNKKYKVR